MKRIHDLLTIVAVGAALLSLASPASADYWPGPRAAAGDWPQPYRGSYNQASTLVHPGIGTEDSDQLAVDWSVTSPDPAQRETASAPIVIGDAVYVANESLTRYDRQSGDIVWRVPLDSGSYSRRASLAYERGIVVVTDPLSPRSYIYGFDAADGRQLWKRGTPYSANMAPSIKGDTVYVFTGSEVMALFLRGGAIRWQSSLPCTTSCSGIFSRAIPSTDGTLVYVPAGYGRIAALDAQTGALAWDQTFPDNFSNFGYQGRNAPIGGGRLFVSTGIGTVRALDAASGAALWERQMVDDADHITLGRFVYVLTTDTDNRSGVMALDPASGAEVWTHFEDGSGNVQPVTSAGGVLYLPVSTPEGGRLVTLDALSGDVSGSIDFDGAVRGPIAVAYGHVYLAAGSQTVSLSPEN